MVSSLVRTKILFPFMERKQASLFLTRLAIFIYVSFGWMMIV